MEMNKLKAMPEALRLQHFARHDQVRRAQAELRVLSPARRPFSRAFAMQSYPDPDVGLDAHFLCNPQRLFQFLQFFDNYHDRLAETTAKHGRPDKGSVLVAVANNKALGVLVHRKRGDQLRLAARFKTEMKLRTSVDNLFDHLAQLIHLDRKDAAILVAITELLHGRVKGAVDRFDPMAQQILKPQDKRKTEAALACFVDHF